MSSPRPRPLFRAPLYQDLPLVDGGRRPRFLLPTAWQVRASDGARVLGHPWNRRSLLVLDDLYLSVLPFQLRTVNRIHVRPRGGVGEPWNGIPCDLGECAIWIVNADLGSSLQLTLAVRLPQTAASPEPEAPLIGGEFLRRYHPRLALWYDRFAYDLSSTPTEPVGQITWS